jgi:hypothetical protein
VVILNLCEIATILGNRMNKRKKKSLVIQSLENVSKEVFKNHSGLIAELVGTSPGVYALYDDMGLYYSIATRTVVSNIL